MPWGKPTVALIVGVTIHEGYLDTLIQQVAQDGKVLAQHKVARLGKSWLGISQVTPELDVVGLPSLAAYERPEKLRGTPNSSWMGLEFKYPDAYLGGNEPGTIAVRSKTLN